MGDEMIYPDSIPYMKTVVKKVALYAGNPMGKGNLVFLYTNSVNESIRLMNQTENFYPNNKYYFYFYPPRYKGSIMGKKYYVNEVKVRDEINKRISEETSIHPYPRKLTITEMEARNTFYDLSRFLQIFWEYSEKYPVMKQIAIYWKMLEPVFKETYGKLNNKTILINANNFVFSKTGKLKDKIRNPLYLIYYSLFNYKKFATKENPDFFKSLDIDFLVFSHEKVLRFNLSKCDEKSYRILLTQLSKLYGSNLSEEIDTKEILDSSIETVEEKGEVFVQVDKISENDVEEVEENPLADREESLKQLDVIMPEGAAKMSLKKMVKSVATNVEKTMPELPKEEKERVIEAETNEKLQEDTKLIEEIYNEMLVEKTPHSQRSTARDQQLREEQKNLKFRNTTLSDLAKIDPKETEIEEVDISNTITTSNPNMKKIKFQNFNKSYVDKLMDKDIVGVFESLNEASIGMFIRSIDVEETSNVLNYKETWTVHLEDENRQRHTIKVDIPKFYDKNFLWLSGNKKIIKNQDFFLPVVKISNDTVMIVTNYNKMSIQRVDNRSLREVTLLEKQINSSEKLQEYFTPGTVALTNQEYITTLEYDEYSKKFTKFKSPHVVIYFSQKEATEKAASLGVEIPKGYMFIGRESTDNIFINTDTQVDDEGRSISDIIMDNLPEDDIKEIRKLNVPKRLMYTKVTTMKQDVPIGILMCLWEGLSTVLRKGKIKFRLESSRRSITHGEDSIQFANCYLIYKSTVPAELLLNGLKFMDTKQYNISEMDTQTPYIPYIEKKYGKISILNALNNVYEFTIGNIEKEILTDMNLPTDLISLMVYANELLADNQNISELDQSQYRVRCAEVIPAILYDCIAKAYVPFKNSNGKKKLSIPQDSVIKKLLALQTVEDYSSLNPFLELESTHGVSTKGWRGVNLEDSYTIPKRCYDDSMIGIIGVSSSPDGQVGVNRTLTMEPNINSARGYLDIKSNKLDELKDVNLFSPAEMLIPMGATRDEPVRTGHNVKQSRACIPIKNSSPVLISNGADDICRHYLSSDFVVNAEQDGTVLSVDAVTKLMIVQYKDGSHKAINLDKNLVKNGGGGFELSNVLITDLKVGDKFKANDCLAWHKDFFKKIPTQGVRMCVGALTKIALFSSYNTYEDANFITESLSDKCETEMCFRIAVSIGKNSNVFKMLKVGDNVAVGDPLIEFDESFDEGDINKLLDSLGDNADLKEAVMANNKNSKKTHYSGTIEEIKIYSASELEELSPSLQEIVSNYYKKIDRKNKQLSKYDKSNSIVKCGLMVTESSGKTEPDRYGNIRGVKVNDGVLIEFYVKHAEPLEVGSKVANFGPLKNIVSEIIPAGYEPRSEFRPEEIIESTISPSSILNRMVDSVLPTMFGNKVIIELKRHLEEIWRGSGEFTTKRSKMCNTIYKVFSALDKTGDNTKRYKEMFNPMSETQFKKFFSEFFQNPDHYLILDIVDYERDVTVEDIQKAADVIHVPLFEYVSFPHYTMDKEHPMVTKYKIPSGYIHMKRPQQTVMKKNGISTSSEQRSAITNQVMGADKNGRESDLENAMLRSLGMTYSLKELNGPRADDMVAKKEMLQAISTKGYVTLEELTDEVENKTTLNTVDTYFYGMGLCTDLVTKGLKLPSTLRKGE